MSDLFGSMSIALGALQMNQEALDVTANNIANINTPNYSRQQVNIAQSDVVTYGSLQFGTGAHIQNIESVRNQVLDLRIYDSTQKQSGLDAFLGPMQQIEAAFNETSGTGLQTAISKFFGSWSQLSVDPSSVPGRQNVISQGQNLAATLNQASRNLNSMRVTLNQQVDQIVPQVNSLTASIAKLNLQINQAKNLGQNTGVLQDQRGTLLQNLSQLINISVTNVNDGSLTVSTAGGQALVVGAQSFNIQVQTDTTSGMDHVISANGTDITAGVSAGQLGGILQVRDQYIPSMLSQLDSLAAGIATAVNSAHAAGTDLNGNPGGNFFSVPATTAGAAGSIAVAITSPSLIAASLDGSAGDNANALALASLQNQTIVSGQTPIDYYTNTVSQLGNAISSATTESTSQSAVLQQLQNQRNSVSGVSLDEEAANLVRFQRAYEAAARLVSVVDQLTTTAIHLGEATG